MVPELGLSAARRQIHPASQMDGPLAGRWSPARQNIRALRAKASVLARHPSGGTGAEASRLGRPERSDFDVFPHKITSGGQITKKICAPAAEFLKCPITIASAENGNIPTEACP